MRRLPLVRFRFAEEDHEKYGDDWWEFDEAKLNSLRARELIAIDDALKAELGMNILATLQAFLRGDVRGALGVMWMARRIGGVDEPLGEFDPLPMVAEAEYGEVADADPPVSSSSPQPDGEAG